MRPLSLLLLCTASIYISAEVCAREYLLDGWRLGDGESTAVRRELMEAGITPELILTVDYAKPVAGGSDHDASVMGNIDFVLDIDAEKALGWTGAEFFLYVLGNHQHTAGDGEFLTDKLGNAQVSSNIEAPTSAKIYELWYDQTFPAAQSGHAWSLRFGLYDLNSEFDVIESAAGLINSSFGIGPDLAQSGENGPSIFPTTSLALRLRYASDDGAYAQFALFDGIPGDPDNERGTHVHPGGGDGVLQVVEAGLAQPAEADRRYRKFAVGIWRYNPRHAEIAIDEHEQQQSSRNSGYYVIGEYQLVQEQADNEQGLRAFLRYGRANDDINAIRTYTGVGASYLGVFGGRDADQLSLGIAVARFGDAFIDAERLAGNDVSGDETIYEVSYRLQVSPWFALQPDLQRIRKPVGGGDDVTLALLRAEVVF